MQGQDTQVVKGQFAMSHQLNSLQECQQVHQEMALLDWRVLVTGRNGGQIQWKRMMGCMFYQCKY